MAHILRSFPILNPSLGGTRSVVLHFTTTRGAREVWNG